MNNMRKAAEELKYLKKTNPALAEKLASEILDGLVLEKQAGILTKKNPNPLSEEELNAFVGLGERIDRGEELTPEEYALFDDLGFRYPKEYLRPAIGGGILGGTLGASIGSLAGGGLGNPGKRAAIGAGLGALGVGAAAEIASARNLTKQAASFADAMHAQDMSQAELEKYLQGVAFKNDPAGAVSKRGKKVVDNITGAALDAGDAIAGGARSAGSAIAGGARSAGSAIANSAKGVGENAALGAMYAGDAVKGAAKGVGENAALGAMYAGDALKGVGDEALLRAMYAADWAKANPGKAGLIGGGIIGAGAGTAALINAIKNSSDEKVAAAWTDYIEKFACAVLDEKLASEAAGEILKKAEFKPGVLSGNPEWQEAGGMGYKEYFDNYGKGMLQTMAGGTAIGTGIGALVGRSNKAIGTGLGALAGGTLGLLAGEVASTPAAIDAWKRDNAAMRQMALNRIPEDQLAQMSDEDIRRIARKANWFGIFPDKQASDEVGGLLKQAGLFSSKDERQKARAIRQSYMNADNGDTGSVMKDQLMAEYEEPSDFGAFDDTLPGGKLNQAKVKEVIRAVKSDPRYAETLDRLDTDSNRALAGLGLGLLTGAIGGGALGGKLGGDAGLILGSQAGVIGGSVLGAMAAQAMNAKNIADIDPALIQAYSDRYNTEVPAKIEEIMGQGAQSNLNVTLGLEDYMKLKAAKERAAQGQTGNY